MTSATIIPTPMENRLMQELRAVGLFEGVEDEMLLEVARVVRPMAFLPGTEIIREGEFGDSMYFLMDGLVEVLSGGLVLETLSRGDIFGEMALVTGNPRAATVRAVEHCGVLRMSIKDFRSLRAFYPQFNAALHALVNQRIRSSARKLAGS
jgi:CPA1 family monovalent cation:H+ antiporter